MRGCVVARDSKGSNDGDEEELVLKLALQIYCEWHCLTAFVGLGK